MHACMHAGGGVVGGGAGAPTGARDLCPACPTMHGVPGGHPQRCFMRCGDFAHFFCLYPYTPALVLSTAFNCNCSGLFLHVCLCYLVSPSIHTLASLLIAYPAAAPSASRLELRAMIPTMHALSPCLLVSRAAMRAPGPFTGMQLRRHARPLCWQAVPFSDPPDLTDLHLMLRLGLT